MNPATLLAERAPEDKPKKRLVERVRDVMRLIFPARLPSARCPPLDTPGQTKCVLAASAAQESGLLLCQRVMSDSLTASRTRERQRWGLESDN